MPTFVLDSSRLAGAGFGYLETTIEGRGRSIAVTWSSSNLDENMELFGYSIRFWAAEPEAKESA